MFDFAWSEIALIGVVALVAIGPKDMPVAIKAAARMMKKARRMAHEFQSHVDELVREADLHEVRDQLNSLRGVNLRNAVERVVDSDGAIRRTLRDDPFKPDPALPPLDEAEHTVDLRPAHEISQRQDHPSPPEPPLSDAPAPPHPDPEARRGGE